MNTLCDWLNCGTYTCCPVVFAHKKSLPPMHMRMDSLIRTAFLMTIVCIGIKTNRYILA